MKRQPSSFMLEAIREAQTAASLGEIPVGCVIEYGGEIIARGHNTRETGHTALGHAEINAIAQACERRNSWRLSGCTLYVTLEPCPMCMGAILNARIDRVIFGAWDSKAGCCGSLVDLNRLGFNHRPEVMGGIREMACAGLLSDFFARCREGENPAVHLAELDGAADSPYSGRDKR